jgi:hypothetical protein
MSAVGLSTEHPKKSNNWRLVAIVVVIALAVGILAYVLSQSAAPTQPTTELPRSGPISTYPSSWGIYSGCPGFNTLGNTTTLGLGQVTYPNSWNTTTRVSLVQVYDSVVGSPAFVNTTSGHGWVVYSWSFVQGGSNNPFPNGNTIVGFFILTNGASPNGYVTAFYDIQNGQVSLSAPSITSTETVVCPAETTG